MAAYEYQYTLHSVQTPEKAAAAKAAMDAMTAAGWHVHTACLNFVEYALLWERNGSAAAERVQKHFEESGVLPVRKPRSRAAETAEPA